MGRNDLKVHLQDGENVLERTLILRGRECELEPESATIKVILRIQKCGAEVLVEGSVTSRFEIQCALCLAPAEVCMNEAFQRSVRIQPGVEIDVLPDVRDSFMAGIPMKVVCSTGCKGLCPSCGKDRNEGTCGCAAQEEKGPLKHILDEALDRGAD
jgi:uncharacterized metal-binding protein YceD (DUF177 family)